MYVNTFFKIFYKLFLEEFPLQKDLTEELH